MPYIPKHIQKLSPYQSARDLYQGDYLFLDANENCFGPLVELKDIEADVSGYPDTDSTKLRGVLSEYYGVELDEMAIFNGSDEGIPDIITAFSDLGDSVMGLDIGFGMYRSFCEIHKRKYVPIVTDKNFDIILTEEGKGDIEKKLKDARVCFLDTPNNPSGNAQSREAMEWLIETAGKTDTLLIIDEAYNQFEDEPEKSSFIKLAPKFSHVLVMRSFSKKWSLAGGRVGAIVGNKELIHNLIKVRIPYHVSAVSEALGITTVGRRQEMERRCELIKEYKAELSSSLTALGLHVYQSQANFLLVKLPKNSREIFDRLVNEYKIVLRYFGAKDTLAGEDNKLANCVRITVGLPEQNERLLKALKGMLKADV